MNNNDVPRLAVFSQTAEIGSNNHLIIGGCDAVELAKKYGTPLWVYDETDLRSRCREYKEEFGKLYPNTTIAYSP
ncbi:MAG: hypothetical protein PHG35_05525, partial [Dehalococcoidales bacterium]|nr:hypothetical protein [Dehalococcoidales bacterium]